MQIVCLQVSCERSTVAILIDCSIGSTRNTFSTVVSVVCFFFRCVLSVDQFSFEQSFHRRKKFLTIIKFCMELFTSYKLDAAHECRGASFGGGGIYRNSPEFSVDLAAAAHNYQDPYRIIRLHSQQVNGGCISVCFYWLPTGINYSNGWKLWWRQVVKKLHDRERICMRIKFHQACTRKRPAAIWRCNFCYSQQDNLKKKEFLIM